jgi:site-specific recombinase XerD
LEQLRDRYLATRGDKAADTIAADKNSFRKAVGHFGGTTLLSSIKREQVRQFITALKESGESQGAVNHYCRHLRAAFNEAMEWEPPPVRINPFANLKLKKVSTKIPRLFTGEVREAIMAAIEDEDFRRMVEVYAATGARRIELVMLKGEDVREREIIVRGKGGKWRAIPITPATRSILGDVKKDEYAFPRWRDPDVITRMFRVAATAAGYPGTTPHHLRHTTESVLAAQGVDLKGRMQMLGHSTVEMALHYTHVTREQLLDALNRIDGDRERKTQGV